MSGLDEEPRPLLVKRSEPGFDLFPVSSDSTAFPV